MTRNLDTALVVVPLTLLPAEKVANPNPADIAQQKEDIYSLIVTQDNSAIQSNTTAWNLFIELGGDVMINAFACNFIVNGAQNTDVVGFKTLLLCVASH
jgi:hypothetical protein